jgi:hypothetical protein
VALPFFTRVPAANGNPSQPSTGFRSPTGFHRATPSAMAGPAAAPERRDAADGRQDQEERSGRIGEDGRPDPSMIRDRNGSPARVMFPARSLREDRAEACRPA